MYLEGQLEWGGCRNGIQQKLKRIVHTKSRYSAAVLPTVAYTFGTLHSGQVFLKEAVACTYREGDKKDSQKWYISFTSYDQYPIQ